MGRKRLYALLFGNRSHTFHPCDDQCLGHIGKSIFNVKRRRGTKTRTHSGTRLVFPSCSIEYIHLLSYCTVKALIAGMESYHSFLSGIGS